MLVYFLVAVLQCDASLGFDRSVGANMISRCHTSSRLGRFLSLRILFYSIISYVVCLPVASSLRADVASEIQSELSSMAMVGFSAVDVVSGKIIAESNADKPLKPASTIKLITSAAALEHLGADFQFQTTVLSDAQLGNSGTRKLWLRGGGDPSLTTEGLWSIARALKKRGVRSVSDLIVDESFFVSSRQRSGQRAYESGTSALAFNYNSLAFSVCPNPGGGVGLVAVEPFESSIALVSGVTTVSGSGVNLSVLDATMSDGRPTYRLTGEIGRSHGCSEAYRSIGDPAQLAGTVLAGFLEYLGIPVKSIENGVAPTSAILAYKHQSKSLSQILEDLNHFSTNMIAEQVLTRLGENNGRCSHDHGIEILEDYINNVASSKAEGTVIVDGSGLSHNNRIRADTFTSVLSSMHRNPVSGIEYIKSLSVGGRSGTLKHRQFDSGFVRAKTGTINGVNALAGYLATKSGRTIAFALLQNRGVSQSEAWELERRVLGLLAKKL